MIVNCGIIKYFCIDRHIKLVKTDDPRLVNRIVARRINFGSLDSYSVITADISRTRNIGEFVKEYFDYTSGNSERVRSCRISLYLLKQLKSISYGKNRNSTQTS
mgnify:CR=1 FL=1